MELRQELYIQQNILGTELKITQFTPISFVGLVIFRMYGSFQHTMILGKGFFAVSGDGA